MFTLVFLFFIFQIFHAEIFNIGPGQQYAELGDIDWMNLEAGDNVRIHHRTTPYRSKILIHSRGTPTERIVIEGIKGPEGQLPHISGDGATTSAQFEGLFSTEWDEFLGPIIVKRSSGAGDPWGYKPGYITFKNIKITQGHPDYQYQSMAGVWTSYSIGAAGIWIILAEDVIVHGCEFSNNANGFFMLSKSDQEEVSRDLLVEHCFFNNNGVSGSDRQHHIYTQVVGATFQYNRILHLTPGASGATLKDRSLGTVIRYNWLISNARNLDLVDPEDQSENNIFNEVLFYRDTYVYGNIFINVYEEGKQYSGSIVHYGGDSGRTTSYRNGTLQFYHNTIHIKADNSESWRSRLFDMDTYEQRVEIRNNIVYKNGSTYLYLMRTNGQAFVESFNFISSFWNGGQDEGGTGFNGDVTINSTPFDGDVDFINDENNEYGLKPSSMCIDLAVDLSGIIPTEFMVNSMYSKHCMSVARSDFNLGAGNIPVDTTIESNYCIASPNPPRDITGDIIAIVVSIFVALCFVIVFVIALVAIIVGVLIFMNKKKSFSK